MRAVSNESSLRVLLRYLEITFVSPYWFADVGTIDECLYEWKGGSDDAWAFVIYAWTCVVPYTEASLGESC